MLINLNFVYPSIGLQKIFLPESQNKYFSSILFAFLKSSTLKFEKAKNSFLYQESKTIKQKNRQKTPFFDHCTSSMYIGLLSLETDCRTCV